MKKVDTTNEKMTLTSLVLEGEDFTVHFEVKSQTKALTIVGRLENVHFSTKGTFDLENAVLVFDAENEPVQQDKHEVLDRLLNTLSYANFYKILDEALVLDTDGNYHFDQEQIEQASSLNESKETTLRYIYGLPSGYVIEWHDTLHEKKENHAPTYANAFISKTILFSHLEQPIVVFVKNNQLVETFKQVLRTKNS